MERDPAVFCIGEDIAVWGGGGVYGVTRGLVETFGPERIRDTPVSEEGIVGLSVGAALVGLRPVAEIMYSDFLTLAMDPIVNQAAKLRYMFGGQASVPMVVRTNSGSPGSKAAQHSQSLEAWFMHIPGLKVVTPATPYDAKGLLKSAIRDDDPVIFLEHKRLYFQKGHVPAEDYVVPIGEAARPSLRGARHGRGQPAVGRPGTRRRGNAGGGGDRARGHRRPDDQPARHGHHQRVVARYRPAADRA